MVQSTTQSDIVSFVQAVEQRPCLYDTNSPLYSDREESARAWKEISDMMGSTVADCRDKWRNLRISYARTLKNPTVKPYYLAKYMEFLIPFLKTQEDIFKAAAAKKKQHAESPYNELQSAPILKIELGDQDSSFSEELDTLETTQEQEVYLLDNYENNTRSKKIEGGKRKRTESVADDPRKMFLLSILPEVNAMDDSEMRLFRRKVVACIDDIFNARENKVNS